MSKDFIAPAMLMFPVDEIGARALYAYFTAEDRIGALSDAIKALGGCEKDADAVVFGLALRQEQIASAALKAQVSSTLLGDSTASESQ